MVRETRHLWVGNLPDNISEDKIRNHFKRYGRVQNVKLLSPLSSSSSSTSSLSRGGKGPNSSSNNSSSVSLPPSSSTLAADYDGSGTPGGTSSSSTTSSGICAAVSFMDIKSAAKAHDSDQILDEHSLTTEYYEPLTPPPTPPPPPAVSGVTVGSSLASQDLFSSSASPYLITSSSTLTGSNEDISSHFFDHHHHGQCEGGNDAVAGYSRKSVSAFHVVSPSESLRNSAGISSNPDRLYGNNGHSSSCYSPVDRSPLNDRRSLTPSWSSYETGGSNHCRYPAADIPDLSSELIYDAGADADEEEDGSIQISRQSSPIIVVHKKHPRARRKCRLLNSRHNSKLKNADCNNARSRGSRSHSSSSSSTSRSRSSSSSSAATGLADFGRSYSNDNQSRLNDTFADDPAVTNCPSPLSRYSGSSQQLYTEDQRSLAICVRNLPYEYTDIDLREELYQEYSKHGQVSYVKIVDDGINRYGVVYFKSYEDVENALLASQDKVILDSKVDACQFEDCDEIDDQDYPILYDRFGEPNLDEYHPKATRYLYMGNIDEGMRLECLRDILNRYTNDALLNLWIQRMPKRRGLFQAIAEYADIKSVITVLYNSRTDDMGSHIVLGFARSPPTNCIWLEYIRADVNDKIMHTAFTQFGRISHFALDRIRKKALVFFEEILSAATGVCQLRSIGSIMGAVISDFASRELQYDFCEKMKESGQKLSRCISKNGRRRKVNKLPLDLQLKDLPIYRSAPCFGSPCPAHVNPHTYPNYTTMNFGLSENPFVTIKDAWKLAPFYPIFEFPTTVISPCDVEQTSLSNDINDSAKIEEEEKTKHLVKTKTSADKTTAEESRPGTPLYDEIPEDGPKALPLETRRKKKNTSARNDDNVKNGENSECNHHEMSHNLISPKYSPSTACMSTSTLEKSFCTTSSSLYDDGISDNSHPNNQNSDTVKDTETLRREYYHQRTFSMCALRVPPPPQLPPPQPPPPPPLLGLYQRSNSSSDAISSSSMLRKSVPRQSYSLDSANELPSNDGISNNGESVANINGAWKSSLHYPYDRNRLFSQSHHHRTHIIYNNSNCSNNSRLQQQPSSPKWEEKLKYLDEKFNRWSNSIKRRIKYDADQDKYVTVVTTQEDTAVICSKEVVITTSAPSSRRSSISTLDEKEQSIPVTPPFQTMIASGVNNSDALKEAQLFTNSCLSINSDQQNLAAIDIVKESNNTKSSSKHHKLLKAEEICTRQSDILRSVLAKKSIFDDDSKRLQICDACTTTTTAITTTTAATATTTTTTSLCNSNSLSNDINFNSNSNNNFPVKPDVNYNFRFQYHSTNAINNSANNIHSSNGNNTVTQNSSSSLSSLLNRSSSNSFISSSTASVAASSSSTSSITSDASTAIIHKYDFDKRTVNREQDHPSLLPSSGSHPIILPTTATAPSSVNSETDSSKNGSRRSSIDNEVMLTKKLSIMDKKCSSNDDPQIMLLTSVNEKLNAIKNVSSGITKAILSVKNDYTANTVGVDAFHTNINYKQTANSAIVTSNTNVKQSQLHNSSKIKKPNNYSNSNSSASSSSDESKKLSTFDMFAARPKPSVGYTMYGRSMNDLENIGIKKEIKSESSADDSCIEETKSVLCSEQLGKKNTIQNRSFLDIHKYEDKDNFHKNIDEHAIIKSDNEVCNENKLSTDEPLYENILERDHIIGSCIHICAQDDDHEHLSLQNSVSTDSEKLFTDNHHHYPNMISKCAVTLPCNQLKCNRFKDDANQLQTIEANNVDDKLIFRKNSTDSSSSVSSINGNLSKPSCSINTKVMDMTNIVIADLEQSQQKKDDKDKNRTNDINHHTHKDKKENDHSHDKSHTDLSKSSSKHYDHHPHNHHRHHSSSHRDKENKGQHDNKSEKDKHKQIKFDKKEQIDEVVDNKSQDPSRHSDMHKNRSSGSSKHKSDIQKMNCVVKVDNRKSENYNRKFDKDSKMEKDKNSDKSKQHRHQDRQKSSSSEENKKREIKLKELDCKKETNTSIDGGDGTNDNKDGGHKSKLENGKIINSSLQKILSNGYEHHVDKQLEQKMIKDDDKRYSYMKLMDHKNNLLHKKQEITNGNDSVKFENLKHINHNTNPSPKQIIHDSKQTKDELKKKHRLKENNNAVITCSESETGSHDEELKLTKKGSKQRMLDTVREQEPVYISMYDKVKARSTKNLQKQEDGKSQEKLKEKFNQLKQSRAKRVEKKRSTTSNDEDTDSDKRLKTVVAIPAATAVVAVSAPRRKLSLYTSDDDDDDDEREVVNEEEEDTHTPVVVNIDDYSNGHNANIKITESYPDQHNHRLSVSPDNINKAEYQKDIVKCSSSKSKADKKFKRKFKYVLLESSDEDNNNDVNNVQSNDVTVSDEPSSVLQSLVDINCKVVSPLKTNAVHVASLLASSSEDDEEKSSTNTTPFTRRKNFLINSDESDADHCEIEDNIPTPPANLESANDEIYANITSVHDSPPILTRADEISNENNDKINKQTDLLTTKKKSKKRSSKDKGGKSVKIKKKDILQVENDVNIVAPLYINEVIHRGEKSSEISSEIIANLNDIFGSMSDDSDDTQFTTTTAASTTTTTTTTITTTTTTIVAAAAKNVSYLPIGVCDVDTDFNIQKLTSNIKVDKIDSDNHIEINNGENITQKDKPNDKANTTTVNQLNHVLIKESNEHQIKHSKVKKKKKRKKLKQPNHHHHHKHRRHHHKHRRHHHHSNIDDEQHSNVIVVINDDNVNLVNVKMEEKSNYDIIDKDSANKVALHKEMEDEKLTQPEPVDLLASLVSPIEHHKSPLSLVGSIVSSPKETEQVSKIKEENNDEIYNNMNECAIQSISNMSISIAMPPLTSTDDKQESVSGNSNAGSEVKSLSQQKISLVKTDIDAEQHKDKTADEKLTSVPLISQEETEDAVAAILANSPSSEFSYSEYSDNSTDDILNNFGNCDDDKCAPNIIVNTDNDLDKDTNKIDHLSNCANEENAISKLTVNDKDQSPVVAVAGLDSGNKTNAYVKTNAKNLDQVTTNITMNSINLDKKEISIINCVTSIIDDILNKVDKIICDKNLLHKNNTGGDNCSHDSDVVELMFENDKVTEMAYSNKEMVEMDNNKVENNKLLVDMVIAEAENNTNVDSKSIEDISMEKVDNDSQDVESYSIKHLKIEQIDEKVSTAIDVTRNHHFNDCHPSNDMSGSLKITSDILNGFHNYCKMTDNIAVESNNGISPSHKIKYHSGIEIEDKSANENINNNIDFVIGLEQQENHFINDEAMTNVTISSSPFDYINEIMEVDVVSLESFQHACDNKDLSFLQGINDVSTISPKYSLPVFTNVQPDNYAELIINIQTTDSTDEDYFLSEQNSALQSSSAIMGNVDTLTKEFCYTSSRPASPKFQIIDEDNLENCIPVIETVIHDETELNASKNIIVTRSPVCKNLIWPYYHYRNDALSNEICRLNNFHATMNRNVMNVTRDGFYKHLTKNDLFNYLKHQVMKVSNNDSKLKYCNDEERHHVKYSFNIKMQKINNDNSNVNTIKVKLNIMDCLPNPNKTIWQIPRIPIESTISKKRQIYVPAMKSKAMYPIVNVWKNVLENLINSIRFKLIYIKHTFANEDFFADATVNTVCENIVKNGHFSKQLICDTLKPYKYLYLIKYQLGYKPSLPSISMHRVFGDDCYDSLFLHKTDVANSIQNKDSILWRIYDMINRRNTNGVIGNNVHNRRNISNNNLIFSVIANNNRECISNNCSFKKLCVDKNKDKQIVARNNIICILKQIQFEKHKAFLDLLDNRSENLPTKQVEQQGSIALDNESVANVINTKCNETISIHDNELEKMEANGNKQSDEEKFCSSNDVNEIEGKHDTVAEGINNKLFKNKIISCDNKKTSNVDEKICNNGDQTIDYMGIYDKKLPNPDVLPNIKHNIDLTNTENNADLLLESIKCIKRKRSNDEGRDNKTTKISKIENFHAKNDIDDVDYNGKIGNEMYDDDAELYNNDEVPPDSNHEVYDDVEIHDYNTNEILDCQQNIINSSSNNNNNTGETDIFSPSLQVDYKNDKEDSSNQLDSNLYCNIKTNNNDDCINNKLASSLCDNEINKCEYNESNNSHMDQFNNTNVHEKETDHFLDESDAFITINDISCSVNTDINDGLGSDQILPKVNDSENDQIIQNAINSQVSGIMNCESNNWNVEAFMNDSMQNQNIGMHPAINNDNNDDDGILFVNQLNDLVVLDEFDQILRERLQEEGILDDDDDDDDDDESQGAGNFYFNLENLYDLMATVPVSEIHLQGEDNDTNHHNSSDSDSDNDSAFNVSHESDDSQSSENDVDVVDDDQNDSDESECENQNFENSSDSENNSVSEDSDGNSEKLTDDELNSEDDEYCDVDPSINLESISSGSMPINFLAPTCGTTENEINNNDDNSDADDDDDDDDDASIESSIENGDIEGNSDEDNHDISPTDSDDYVDDEDVDGSENESSECGSNVNEDSPYESNSSSDYDDDDDVQDVADSDVDSSENEDTTLDEELQDSDEDDCYEHTQTVSSDSEQSLEDRNELHTEDEILQNIDKITLNNDDLVENVTYENHYQFLDEVENDVINVDEENNNNGEVETTFDGEVESDNEEYLPISNKLIKVASNEISNYKQPFILYHNKSQLNISDTNNNKEKLKMDPANSVIGDAEIIIPAEDTGSLKEESNLGTIQPDQIEDNSIQLKIKDAIVQPNENNVCSDHHDISLTQLYPEMDNGTIIEDDKIIVTKQESKQKKSLATNDCVENVSSQKNDVPFENAKKVSDCEILNCNSDDNEMLNNDFDKTLEHSTTDLCKIQSFMDTTELSPTKNLEQMEISSVDSSMHETVVNVIVSERSIKNPSMEDKIEMINQVIPDILLQTNNQVMDDTMSQNEQHIIHMNATNILNNVSDKMLEIIDASIPENSMFDVNEIKEANIDDTCETEIVKSVNKVTMNNSSLVTDNENSGAELLWDSDTMDTISTDNNFVKSLEVVCNLQRKVSCNETLVADNLEVYSENLAHDKLKNDTSENQLTEIENLEPQNSSSNNDTYSSVSLNGKIESLQLNNVDENIIEASSTTVHIGENLNDNHNDIKVPMHLLKENFETLQTEKLSVYNFNYDTDQSTTIKSNSMSSTDFESFIKDENVYLKLPNDSESNANEFTETDNKVKQYGCEIEEKNVSEQNMNVESDHNIIAIIKENKECDQLNNIHSLNEDTSCDSNYQSKMTTNNDDWLSDDKASDNGNVIENVQNIHEIIKTGNLDQLNDNIKTEEIETVEHINSNQDLKNNEIENFDVQIESVKTEEVETLKTEEVESIMIGEVETFENVIADETEHVKTNNVDNVRIEEIRTVEINEISNTKTDVSGSVDEIDNNKDEEIKNDVSYSIKMDTVKIDVELNTEKLQSEISSATSEQYSVDKSNDNADFHEINNLPATSESYSVLPSKDNNAASSHIQEQCVEVSLDDENLLEKSLNGENLLEKSSNTEHVLEKSLNGENLSEKSLNAENVLENYSDAEDILEKSSDAEDISEQSSSTNDLSGKNLDSKTQFKIVKRRLSNAEEQSKKSISTNDTDKVSLKSKPRRKTTTNTGRKTLKRRNTRNVLSNTNTIAAKRRCDVYDFNEEMETDLKRPRLILTIKNGGSEPPHSTIQLLPPRVSSPIPPIAAKRKRTVRKSARLQEKGSRPVINEPVVDAIVTLKSNIKPVVRRTTRMAAANAAVLMTASNESTRKTTTRGRKPLKNNTDTQELEEIQDFNSNSSSSADQQPYPRNFSLTMANSNDPLPADAAINSDCPAVPTNEATRLFSSSSPPSVRSTPPPIKPSSPVSSRTSSEPTKLIDPVSGLLVPMKESGEGQYVPVLTDIPQPTDTTIEIVPPVKKRRLHGLFSSSPPPIIVSPSSCSQTITAVSAAPSTAFHVACCTCSAVPATSGAMMPSVNVTVTSSITTTANILSSAGTANSSSSSSTTTVTTSSTIACLIPSPVTIPITPIVINQPFPSAIETSEPVQQYHPTAMYRTVTKPRVITDSTLKTPPTLLSAEVINVTPQVPLYQTVPCCSSNVLTNVQRVVVPQYSPSANSRNTMRVGTTLTPRPHIVQTMNNSENYVTVPKTSPPSHHSSQAVPTARNNQPSRTPSIVIQALQPTGNPQKVRRTIKAVPVDPPTLDYLIQNAPTQPMPLSDSETSVPYYDDNLELYMKWQTQGVPFLSNPRSDLSLVNAPPQPILIQQVVPGLHGETAVPVYHSYSTIPDGYTSWNQRPQEVQTPVRSSAQPYHVSLERSDIQEVLPAAAYVQPPYVTNKPERSSHSRDMSSTKKIYIQHPAPSQYINQIPIEGSHVQELVVQPSSIRTSYPSQFINQLSPEDQSVGMTYPQLRYVNQALDQRPTSQDILLQQHSAMTSYDQSQYSNHHSLEKKPNSRELQQSAKALVQQPSSYNQSVSDERRVLDVQQSSARTHVQPQYINLLPDKRSIDQKSPVAAYTAQWQYVGQHHHHHQQQQRSSMSSQEASSSTSVYVHQPQYPDQISNGGRLSSAEVIQSSSAYTTRPQYAAHHHYVLATEGQNLQEVQLSAVDYTRPPQSTNTTATNNNNNSDNHPATDKGPDVNRRTTNTKHPVVWKGNLELKTESAFVQLNYISGNQGIVNYIPPVSLRIAQRMRLGSAQLDPVIKKMEDADQYCILLAIASGNSEAEASRNSAKLRTNFISYLHEKQVAGILNISPPDTHDESAYVIHIFPPSEFIQRMLRDRSPELLRQLHNSPSSCYVALIITTA